MVDTLVSTQGTILFSLLCALGLLALLLAKWESTSLWMLSVWHSIPLVGGIAWLARRQQSRQTTDRGASSSSAVLALCASYARYIRVLSRSDYDNYLNYLRKAGDLGRRPFPPYLRVVIFSMILIEAAGLAYVLAGWTLPGASEFAQRIAALCIGFLIAVVLVFFTHWTGLEIDQVGRYKRDYAEWIAAGKSGPLYGPDLSLNDPQSVDDDEPVYRQRATRGHGKTTYVLSVITLLMVLAVGIGAAYVRGQVLEQEIAAERSSVMHSQQRFDFSGTDSPSEKAANSAEQQSLDEEVAIKRRGGWGTLIILGIIFFFLQLLGVFFGYRHSFNGRLSGDAYRALRLDTFSSYRELLQFYERVADLAQSKVERLQHLMEQRQRNTLSGSRSVTPYSFRDYLHEREMQRRYKPLGAGPTDEAAGANAATPLSASDTAVPAAVATAAIAASAVIAPVIEAAPARAAAAPASASTDAVAQAPVLADAADPLVAEVKAPVAAAPRRRGARAELDQAEKMERQRAAERSVRARPGSNVKSSAQTEPELG